MRNGIVAGFRQTVGKWMLLVPLLIAALILVNFVNPIIRAYQENGRIFEGFHISLLMDGFRADSVSFFLPVLAVLPFSGAFVDDVKNRFARYFLIRSSYRGYLCSRVVTAFLAGGLSILLGALLAWGLTAAVLIPLEVPAMGRPEETDLRAALCLLLFLSGGLWSMVGLAMSTVMESKYIAYSAAFVTDYILVILYERYLPKAFVLSPKNWLQPELWPYGCWGAAIFLLELTALFAILFCIRGERRLRTL